MAIVHRATMQPTKLEIVAGWLPTQSWFTGDAGTLEQVGAFRFDDPDGEVGIQVCLLRTAAGDDSPIYQVPMTYRDAPLDGASTALLGETDHSVLGRRYVYDGCQDPVFVAALLHAIYTGGREADEIVTVDGATTTLPKSIHVQGRGTLSAVPVVDQLEVTSAGGDSSLTVVRTSDVEITIPRILPRGTAIDGPSVLVGEWGDGETACLASAREIGTD